MKKMMKRVLFTLLLSILFASTVLLAYLLFFTSENRNLSGKWTAKLDMTERAAVTALDWLQDIEAVSVSLEDMESYMQGLQIGVTLTLEQTSRDGGVFQCSIQPESYDACAQAAYEAFAAAFQELLAERLRMAGYGGDTDREAVEALVTETFGVSTVFYLTNYAPGLLPSMEELQAQYDGSGIYQTTEDSLTRQYDDGRTITEFYMRKGSSLVLSGETGAGLHPVMYTLQQAQD